jgi:glycosyltransferase involved in cell wall biosynthesis
MRILQLTKALSSRADHGGKLRTYGLGLALSRIADVDILGFSDEPAAALERAPRLRPYRKRYAVDMEAGWRRAAMLAVDLARGQALRTTRYASEAFRRRVAAAVSEESYDAVQVEELSTMGNLPPIAASLPVVYSAHNVETALSQRLLTARQGVLRRLAPLEARRTQAEERRALALSRFCLTVSDDAREALAQLNPSAAPRVHVVPNCVFDEVVPGAPRTAAQEPIEIVTVGCLGWHPNAQGARWFAANVMPLLRRRMRVTVRFVGSLGEAALAAELTAAGCEVSADVGDVLPYLHRARAAFVPLLTGGGTRLKIVEAWAAGVPVVSTPIGAEGLGSTDGVDVLLAPDANGFAQALIRVIEDDELYSRLRENGLRRASTLRWTQQVALLAELYGAIPTRRALGSPRGE